MHIRVSNIVDFIAFIHDAIHNGESFPRVLHSKTPSRAPISFNGKADHVEFTYALFTTKLSVLYSGNVPSEEFETIDRKLGEYRNKEAQFRIQIFKSIKFKDGELHVEGELNVI